MFWDVPDDPRGSLRWSLSKIRPLVDDPAFPACWRIARAWSCACEGLDVDFLSAQACAEEGATATGNLARAASFFRGPLLADLELPENSDFHTWLLGMREDARQLQAKILGLVDRTSERIAPKRRYPMRASWCGLEPFDECGLGSLDRATLAGLQPRREKSDSNTKPDCVRCARSTGDRARCCAPGARRKR